MSGSTTSSRRLAGCLPTLAMLLLGLFVLGIGVGLFLVSAHFNDQHNAVIAQFQTIQATFTACEKIKVENGYTKNTGVSYRTAYLISYQFTYQDKLYSSQAQSDNACENSANQIGVQHPIQFLPSDPTISGFNPESLISNTSSDTFRTIADGVCVVGFFIPIGAVLVLLNSRGKLRTY